MSIGSIARAAVMAWVVTVVCAAQAQPNATFRLVVDTLPDHRSVQLLYREPITPPLRYRVIVVPGSGCTGMGPVAERYFAGLLHAQVLVLHKPGVDANAGLNPEPCPSVFTQNDTLSRWMEDARAVLHNDALARATQPVVPQILVGISEGAELLTKLAEDVPHLAGLVLLSGSGLDPWEAGEMQAHSQGQLKAWQDLAVVQSSNTPDRTLMEGRSLQYWRDLWAWRQSDELIASRWPILRVWGGADALVPQRAYETFTHRAKARSVPICSRSIPGADHGLQAPARDGVQLLWAWLENWGRQTTGSICEAVSHG